MVLEKLRKTRKQKGISQEQMAKILATDTSNYSRKERGEVRIHDEEWEKMAKILDVSIEDIKEKKDLGVYNENPTFNDNSGNYNQYFNMPTSILENLQDYIALLKQENQQLKEENQRLKNPQ